MTPTPVSRSETAADPAAAKDWQLFLDWCEATDRDPATVTPEELVTFQVQLPASPAVTQRRLDAIWDGLGWDRPEKVRQVRSRWAEKTTLTDVLELCPVASWPRGLRGRRDAWLLVLLAPVEQGGVGLSRRAAAAVRAIDVQIDPIVSPERVGVEVRILGRLLPRHDDPLLCPACVAIRWLEVVALEDQWGRGAVKELLVLAKDLDDSHACDGASGEAWRRWNRVHTAFAPAVDQYGWLTTYRPMSTTGISDAIRTKTSRAIDEAEKQKAAAEARAIEEEALSSRRRMWDMDADIDDRRDRRERGERAGALDDIDEETWERLDRVADEADEKNARIAAMLAEIEADVKRIDGML